MRDVALLPVRLAAAYDRVMGHERFTGTLEAGRGGGAFVILPDEVLVALGGGGRFRVLGTINGVDFESPTSFS